MFKKLVYSIIMNVERIVSFLPSATELVFELGCGDKLYGVTHECEYPNEAKLKLRIIESVFDSNSLSSKQIDEKILELMSEGKEIFRLNAENLKDANPALIISQETCKVCSAYTDQVENAVNILDKKLDVLTINPHNIEDILQTIIDISKKIGSEQQGIKLVRRLIKRINYIKNKKYIRCPNVIAIEWIDPFFTAGHWVPEMIEFVGAKNLISKKGEQSRRMTFDEIKNEEPDIIILMPCGFDVERTIKEYKKTLEDNLNWKTLKAVKDQNVFAVDANSFFSKPSLRTITGIEILGKILQPEIFNELEVPPKSYRKII